MLLLLLLLLLRVHLCIDLQDRQCM
jgi:hypothetical protein